MAWAHTRNNRAIAWALIGEWASKELFPPPLHGNWPKHGHDGNLQEAYKQRRPCLVGWARAAFEQGSLPALLSLPGAVETRVLPGDSFFQATHILMDYMRPAVVHGYGGAKVDLPVSLPALAKFGWTTLGASLLGTCSCLPQWCRKDSGDSVRLAPGCDVSFKVAPAPLTISEEVYLMGLWRHLTPAEAAHPSPARDWLARCNPNLSPDQAYFQYQEISEEDRWPSSDSQMHGVQATGIIRLLREQFVRCKLLNLKSWSSFDSKDHILRGSRMQIGNSSCGTPLQWSGIARGLLP